MHSEADIVGQHRVKASRMPLEVLLLHLGNPIEARIEDCVHEEADNVQGDKVEIQADHRGSFPVNVDLRVE